VYTFNFQNFNVLKLTYYVLVRCLSGKCSSCVWENRMWDVPCLDTSLFSNS